MKNIDGVSIPTKGAKEYLEITDKALVQFGRGSFSVSIWVNFQDEGGLQSGQFIGTRNSNRPYYRSKGWSQGSGDMKDEIRFTIDDGEKLSTVAASSRIDGKFDFSGWNHLSAIRDVKNQEIRLYVNGELAAKAKDQTGDLTSPHPLVIGYDYMTGNCLNGLIDDIKLHSRPIAIKP